MAFAAIVGKLIMSQMTGTGAASKAASGMIGDMLTQELMKKQVLEDASKDVYVKAIESKTWYMYRWEENKYWERAKRGLGNRLPTDIQIEYKKEIGDDSEQQVVDVTFRNRSAGELELSVKAPEGMSLDSIRVAALNELRLNMKPYMRAAAAGRARLKGKHR